MLGKIALLLLIWLPLWLNFSLPIASGQDREENRVKLLKYRGRSAVENANSLPSSNQYMLTTGKIQAIDYADLVEELLPSVVNISTIYRVKKGKEISKLIFSNLPSNSVPKELQDSFAELLKDEVNSDIEIKSLGSGFIVDKNGYIVTNTHVIANADEIIVGLDDITKVKAELIGSDVRSDLALLRIRTKRKLKPIKFAEQFNVRVGNPVIVIGNPFGLGASVSAGIISAISRNLYSGDIANHDNSYLQTDAAINQGNSGGPLFNMRGEVIGIASAILSPTGASSGVGFAIPITAAAPIIEQLKRDGKVTRGWLGATIQNIDEQLAKTLGLNSVSGALIVNVVPNGPAAKAGLAVGDVVLRYNGVIVGAQHNNLSQLVANTEINSTVKISVLQRGVENTVTVKIERLVETPPENNEEKAWLGGKYIPQLGLRITAINNEMARQHDLGADEGLLVIAVDDNSEAKEKGIRKGDVITMVNQEKVETITAVEEKLRSLTKARQTTVLLIISKHERNFPLVLNINKVGRHK